jgi:hypothetical protein
VSEIRAKKYITPYIIGASDLAFILLFFFIMVGSGSQKLERIEMPYKSATAADKNTQSPFRIEIYERSSGVDSSRMALIFNTPEDPDTLYVTIDNQSLSQRDAYELALSHISGFIEGKECGADSVRVDIFSSAYSYYGLIAIAIAACNELQYPCNLVYRAEAG